MSLPPIPPHHRIPIFQLAIAFLSIILILQMWLLTGSLDAYLAGNHRVAVPAAVASGVCFLAGLWLLRTVTSGRE